MIPMTTAEMAKRGSMATILIKRLFTLLIAMAAGVGNGEKMRTIRYLYTHGLNAMSLWRHPFQPLVGLGSSLQAKIKTPAHFFSESGVDCSCLIFA